MTAFILSFCSAVGSRGGLDGHCLLSATNGGQRKKGDDHRTYEFWKPDWLI